MKSVLVCGLLLSLLAASVRAQGAPARLVLDAGDFPVQRRTRSTQDGGVVLPAGGELRTGLQADSASRLTGILRCRRQGAAETALPYEILLEDTVIHRGAMQRSAWSTAAFNMVLPQGLSELRIRHAATGENPRGRGSLELADLTLVPVGRGSLPALQSVEAYGTFCETRNRLLLEAADQRILDKRRGALTFRVQDEAGNALPGGRVTLDFVRHRFWFGTALSSSMFDGRRSGDARELYLEKAARWFDAAVPENAMKWIPMQPAPDQMNIDTMERLLAWCESQSLRVRGHGVFWACEKRIPTWVTALDDHALRAAIDSRARYIARLFRGRISEYDLNNEMLHCSYFSDRLGTGIRRQMFHTFQAADPAAVLYLNEFGILNGYRLDAYEALVRRCLENDIPVGGIGIQAHVSPSLEAVDVQRALDRLAAFDLPIRITEFDCDTTDEDEQARVLDEVYRLAFGHPAVDGVLMWGFWEGAHWKPDAALFRRDFSEKPSARAYRNRVLEEWQTRAGGPVGDQGQFVTQAFFGDYRVKVEAEGFLPFERSLTFLPADVGEECPLVLKPDARAPSPEDPVPVKPVKPSKKDEAPGKSPGKNPVEEDIYAPIGM